MALISLSATAVTLTNGAFHVFPADEIQQALDSAATNSVKTVIVHSGLYRPNSARQALIWLNAKHEGIHLVAEGQVTLSAANASLSDPKSPAYPAIVNHLVYFGSGISSNTVIRGFSLTGANNFVAKGKTRQFEPSTQFETDLFFYTDGGAVKIFGRSYPTLDSLVISNNYSSPCAGGISIQHPEGFTSSNLFVTIRNCQFFDNRAQITGAALDLLEGSSAVVDNCLFVRNTSNLGPDFISLKAGELSFTNNAPLTVFRTSWIIVKNTTFTGNRNGVDDLGSKSIYENCIFWKNELQAGLPAPRYEIQFNPGTIVKNCHFSGIALVEPTAKNNILQVASPDFDSSFAPHSPAYR
ncbi:MAG: hypothetical protein JWN25_616, partial [Verrucomicrobiales bacterium]|nr:hypothetical protein [Verrucomicrobiales bacterium]